jgi:hypothetical protein
VLQVNGSKFEVTLKEVKYVPELWVNLFSMNKALKNGFKLSNDGISICISKELSYDKTGGRNEKTMKRIFVRKLSVLK